MLVDTDIVTYGPFEVEADEQGPGVARRWAGNIAVPAVRDPQIGLVISELVTNVVRHTSCPTASVAVVVRGSAVRIEVSDGDPGRPHVVEGKLPPGHGGLGLRIVDTMATRWGVDGHDHGKTVWAEFDPAA